MTSETVPERVKILTEAAELITGDRNKTYGPPTENFSNTAALWNVQIGHKLKTPLTASDVAQLMVQLKMARMIAQPKRDNYVDAAGYLACGAECESAAASEEPATPEVRYFTSGSLYHRWKDEELTFVDASGGRRHKSMHETPERYMETEGREYGAREISVDEVPEWAR